jgi:positive regulator of sigma E activity
MSEESDDTLTVWTDTAVPRRGRWVKYGIDGETYVALYQAIVFALQFFSVLVVVWVADRLPDYVQFVATTLFFLNYIYQRRLDRVQRHAHWID